MKFGNVNAESVAAEIDVFQIILIDMGLEVGGIEFVGSTDFVYASAIPLARRVTDIVGPHEVGNMSSLNCPLA